MANYINPNGREAEYDFAKANPFRRQGDSFDGYNQAVYAQDADGVCYHFLTVHAAAEAVQKNGYCRRPNAVHNIICSNIYRACREGSIGRSKPHRRAFGFDWHFVSDIK